MSAVVILGAAWGAVPAIQAQSGLQPTAVVEGRAIFLPAASLRDLAYPVFAPGDAVVEDVKVSADDLVKKDQVLLTLRSPTLEAKLAAAKAALNFKADYLQRQSEAAERQHTAVEALEKERRKDADDAIAAIEMGNAGNAAAIQAKATLSTKGYETGPASA